MGEATFHTAEDGYPARDAPAWTEEKLMILECYIKAFARACRKAGGWYGLDLFAGTGLNYSLLRNIEIPGSPLIQLDAQPPPATKVLLCEQHDGAREALTHRCDAYGVRSAIHAGDANAVVHDMLGKVPTAAPAFAFLDPEGSELAWETVAAIAAHKRGQARKVEQLILFPTDMGFVRLAPDHPEKVTRIFGHDRWIEIFEARTRGEISADEARGAYVRMYAEGLEGLSYETVLDRQITKEGGQPMYFLLFATDHEAGERIMDHCFDQVRVRVEEELGQQTLFGVKSAPRRKRLGDR